MGIEDCPDFFAIQRVIQKAVDPVEDPLLAQCQAGDSAFGRRSFHPMM